MTPHKNPDEDEAATDAVFEELAEQAEGQAVAGPDPATPPAPRDLSSPNPDEAKPPPVGDYVRELQEEFEEHQDDAMP